MTGQEIFEALVNMTPEQRKNQVLISDSGVYSPVTEIKFQIVYPSFGGFSTQPMRGMGQIEEPNAITLKAD